LFCRNARDVNKVSALSSLGIENVRKFWDKSNIFREVIRPRVEGIDDVRLFPLSTNDAKFVISVNWEGKLPENKLSAKFKYVREMQDDNIDGTALVSELSLKSNRARPVKDPSCDGTVEESLFFDKTNDVRWYSLPIDVGSVPANPTCETLIPVT